MHGLNCWTRTKSGISASYNKLGIQIPSHPLRYCSAVSLFQVVSLRWKICDSCTPNQVHISHQDIVWTISFMNTWSFQTNSNSMQNCAPTPCRPNAGLSNSQGSGVTPKPCQLSRGSAYKTHSPSGTSFLFRFPYKAIQNCEAYGIYSVLE